MQGGEPAGSAYEFCTQGGEPAGSVFEFYTQGGEPAASVYEFYILIFMPILVPGIHSGIILNTRTRNRNDSDSNQVCQKMCIQKMG